MFWETGHSLRPGWPGAHALPYSNLSLPEGRGSFKPHVQSDLGGKKLVILLSSLLSFSSSICQVSTEVMATEFLYGRTCCHLGQFAQQAN